MNEDKKSTIVIMHGKAKEVGCDILKLSNTMWNKEGDKYTEEEMYEMGFERK